MTYRDDLPGYRLGEGAPLERERIKAHLEGCPDCRTQLEAYETLVRDAREEPPALNIADKDRIWKGIESQLPSAEPSIMESLSRLLRPQWQPALGLVAACLAYVVLVNPVAEESRAPTKVEPMAAADSSPNEPATNQKALRAVVAELKGAESHNALEVAPGVEARTTKRAAVRKTGTASAPRVELTQGDLLAEYTRQPKQEPMVVQTPHFEAIIRGTIFIISVDDSGSTLTVADGKVEARRGGLSVMVNAGHSLRVESERDDQANQTETLNAPQPEETYVIREMKDLFPEHKAKAEVPVVKPATQPKLVRPQPKEPSIQDPELALKRARDAWLNGKLEAANEMVSALLRYPSLEPKLQDDARLLRASVLRARGKVNEAMLDLEVVASMGRDGSRVAAFELGRLAKEQGRLVTAKRALKQVLRTDERDVLGEEARFELCQLLTREGSDDESVECWQALQDASDPSLRDKANQALNER